MWIVPTFWVLSETSLGEVLEAVTAEAPEVLIVDSIQTLYNDALDSPAGSISQVKDCAMALMQVAKGQGITVFVIGHVNKEGSIAGPKVLEHMVDCVLYFEGDQRAAHRILRARQEPLRRHQRDRRVRNAGQWSYRGGEPFGAAAVRPSRGCAGHLRHLRYGGCAAVLAEIQALVVGTLRGQSPAAPAMALTTTALPCCWRCWTSGED